MLIPQIVLSGAIFAYEPMPRAGRLVADALVSGRWIERATALSLAGDANAASRAAGNLGAHAALYFLVACLTLLLRDRRGGLAR